MSFQDEVKSMTYGVVDMRSLIELQVRECHDWGMICGKVRRLTISAYMRKYKGNQTKVSQALDVDRGTLRKWIADIAEQELNDADSITAEELSANG